MEYFSVFLGRKKSNVACIEDIVKEWKVENSCVWLVEGWSYGMIRHFSWLLRALKLSHQPYHCIMKPNEPLINNVNVVWSCLIFHEKRIYFDTTDDY